MNNTHDFGSVGNHDVDISHDVINEDSDAKLARSLVKAFRKLTAEISPLANVYLAAGCI